MWLSIQAIASAFAGILSNLCICKRCVSRVSAMEASALDNDGRLLDVGPTNSSFSGPFPQRQLEKRVAGWSGPRT